MPDIPAHGANLFDASARTGLPPSAFLDASASLAPWTPPLAHFTPLHTLRVYPDPLHSRLKSLLGTIHGLPPDYFLAGNGASELFTWVARDAASLGKSVLPAPCFADYERALLCWDSAIERQYLPTDWVGSWPSEYPSPPPSDVLWVCNPHNPTGQLWSRNSLAALTRRYRLVICDEAFLPLVPNGDDQSLIPYVFNCPNLIVIRSLTKLFGIAGVRLGYAVAHPERLARWSHLRDPWPLNGLALRLGERLLANPRRYRSWCRKVQHWTAVEGSWLFDAFSCLPGLTPKPSAANYMLINSEYSLLPLKEALETRHQILLRDCRSFLGLDEHWLRVGYQSRRRNRRIVKSVRKEFFHSIFA